MNNEERIMTFWSSESRAKLAWAIPGVSNLERSSMFTFRSSERKVKLA